MVMGVEWNGFGVEEGTPESQQNGAPSGWAKPSNKGKGLLWRGGNLG